MSAISLATKGILSFCRTITSEQIIGGGGGAIIKEECIIPSINITSFKLEESNNNIYENKIIIKSINVLKRDK